MPNIVIKGIKKVLGPSVSRVIAPTYHGMRGYITAYIHHYPARSLKLIGITGTKGKTSTTILTGRLFNEAGIKTGYISTATINKTGLRSDEYQNPYKMTNADPAVMQRLLAEMVSNGCTHVVIELSSEGLHQNRHYGLGEFDCTVFLNLYPEHIESHGSLQNYMKAKARLFRLLKNGGVFIGNGYQKFVQDKIVDDQLERTKFMAQAIRYHDVTKYIITPGLDYHIERNLKTGTKSCMLDGISIQTAYYADFEIRNMVCALFILKAMNKDAYTQFLHDKHTYFLHETTIPGRMDWVVKDGVMVD